MTPIILRAGGLIAGTLVFVTLIGCNKSQPDVQYVAAPAPAPAAAPAPATVVQEQPTVVVQQDDYVYYPAYEVYYSRSRHDYHYRDGNAWVTRSAPPRVSVDVLFASPSVRLDFHDAPERHHETVFRSYPRNWSPPGHDHDDRNDRKDDHKDDHREKR